CMTCCRPRASITSRRSSPASNCGITTISSLARRSWCCDRMSELHSRPLMTVEFTLHPVQDLGVTPYGHRRVFPVSGGKFEGARLRGAVLPHAGGDWLLTRSDGAFQQDVRVTLETHDGALILMTYRGVRHASPEVIARIANGQPVDRSEYYL